MAEVRRVFTPEEIRTYLAKLVPRVEAAAKACAEGEDEFEAILPPSSSA